MWLLLLFIGFLLWNFPVLRCAVFNPFFLLFYAVRDAFFWVRHLQFNLCGTGRLVAYTGLFGKGKTCSAVHKVVGLYRSFDGKKVWCPERKKIVRQKILILSNVELKTVPYKKLESLQQIVDLAKMQKKVDFCNDTLTAIIVLGDEFSVQLNSRSFRDNIDAPFLNALLTCRHYHLSIFYTTQRFQDVDALLRRVTSYVVECQKTWRFMLQYYYDAWELENATNPRLIKPYARSCWFVRRRDYTAYDTFAVVDDLEKRVKAKDMLTAKEILDLQGGVIQPNVSAIMKPSARLRRWMRKEG